MFLIKKMSAKCRGVLPVFFMSCVMLGVSGTALAEENIQKTFCVYDPIGANGPIFSQMKDYQVAATAWGVALKLKPYTDERVAAEDFKTGLCDMVGVTGTVARQFNTFTGTLDSIGAMPTYEHVKVAMKTLATPKASRLMVQGDYEVAGIIPGGAVYLFVRDRMINKVSALSGKRVAILESDAAQKILVMNIGASPVDSSIASMYSKFNNGSVDVCIGPAVVYDAMELYKGIQPNGGIVRFAIGQLTLQLLIRSKSFPDGFAQQSREYAFSQFQKALAVTAQAEERIDARWWIDLPAADTAAYAESFRKARLSLRDQNIYDAGMLTLLRKIRCKLAPEQSECTAVDKE